MNQSTGPLNRSEKRAMLYDDFMNERFRVEEVK